MKDAEFPYPVGAEQSKAATCDHPVWVTHLRGGEPLSVSICQLCGDINWQQLREDLEARGPQLGLASTRDLLSELAARGRTEVHYVELGGAMLMGAMSLLEQLPGSMLDYRTVGEEGHYTKQQPEPVNIEERPEDAARRYAGQLLALQEGLKERGVNLDNICDDHVVRVALECLDEATEAVKANAEIAIALAPGQRIVRGKDGKISAHRERVVIRDAYGNVIS